MAGHTAHKSVLARRCPSVHNLGWFRPRGRWRQKQDYVAERAVDSMVERARIRVVALRTEHSHSSEESLNDVIRK